MGLPLAYSVGVNLHRSRLFSGLIGLLLAFSQGAVASSCDRYLNSPLMKSVRTEVENLRSSPIGFMIHNNKALPVHLNGRDFATNQLELIVQRQIIINVKGLSRAGVNSALKSFREQLQENGISPAVHVESEELPSEAWGFRVDGLLNASHYARASLLLTRSFAEEISRQEAALKPRVRMGSDGGEVIEVDKSVAKSLSQSLQSIVEEVMDETAAELRKKNSQLDFVLSVNNSSESQIIELKFKVFNGQNEHPLVVQSFFKNLSSKILEKAGHS